MCEREREGGERERGSERERERERGSERESETGYLGLLHAFSLGAKQTNV